MAPVRARAMARLVATVDLPTPPLPLATATTLRTPGGGEAHAPRLGPAGEAGAHLRGHLQVHPLHPGEAPHVLPGQALHLPLHRQAGVVSSILKETAPWSIAGP